VTVVAPGEAPPGVLTLEPVPGWDSMDGFLADPAAVARLLNKGALWGISRAGAVALWEGRAAAITMRLEPPVDAAAEGYPTEDVRIVAFANREVFAYPKGPRRPWRHRNQDDQGALCLQHPRDDSALLWQWADGLAPLITRVRFHLLYEESFRRTGLWPDRSCHMGAPPRPSSASSPTRCCGRRCAAGDGDDRRSRDRRGGCRSSPACSARA
jgi:hypothetical protein